MKEQQINVVLHFRLNVLGFNVTVIKNTNYIFLAFIQKQQISSSFD